MKPLPDDMDFIYIAAVSALQCLSDGATGAAEHFVKQIRDVAMTADLVDCEIRDIVDLGTDADFIQWGDE